MLHELRKVTILSTKEDKFEIAKGEGGPSDEFLEERHARFVIPDEAASKKEVQGSIVHGLNEKKKSTITSPLVDGPIDQDHAFLRPSDAIQRDHSMQSLEYAI